MGYIRLCRVGALLAGLLGIVLWVEDRLGRAILPWRGPDPTSGTAAMFILFLAVLLWLAGDLASVRLRVERLERRLRDAEGKHG
jgi:hypothetical protein